MAVENHGVIEAPPKSTDFIAGANSPIIYQIRNPSGNWAPYLVIKERQRFGTLETMACVSFAACSLAEIQIKQQTGVELNFSDRFLAKMSGTTPEGNYLSIVGDTIRKIGTVREEEWPTPPNPTWASYYGFIPQFIVNRAKPQFLDKYEIQTEWVSPTEGELSKHLKHAPLMFLIPGHAIAGVIVDVNSNTATYLDTYGEPFIKTIPINQLQNAFKVLLTVKETTSMFELWDDNGTFFLVGDQGKWGIVDWDTLGEFKRLTNKPVRAGSTANIPLIRNIEKGFVIS